jgi:molybdenum-dependent DNA-binding transcriptional regulator ModE
MNRLASTPLLEKVVSGAGRYHSQLIRKGRKVIQEYKEQRTKFRSSWANSRFFLKYHIVKDILL